MKKKLFTLILLIFFSMLSSNCMAQQQKQSYFTIEIPKGSFVKSVLITRVSTDINRIEDEVKLITTADYIIGEFNCIPKDSIFIGKIVELEKQRKGKDAYFKIMINELKLPDGQKIPIEATMGNNGNFGGEQTEREKWKHVPHYSLSFGSVLQNVPTGERIMGKKFEILPGDEIIVQFINQLKLYVVAE